MVDVKIKWYACFARLGFAENFKPSETSALE